MSIERISENSYSIGIMNPSLRVFDIVMQAKYGTSYNSYFISGQKNVVIDTCHGNFFDEYMNNLRSITDIDKIDYVIVNHTEPDHSGSLKKLLDLNPKIKIVCTAIASKYLKQITNLDLDCICVKDGDSLDIGGRTLKFIVAPMLHWPDSMMTWFEDEKILFSCDFLGSHFCEPTVFDVSIHDKDAYLAEFEYYYNCIFGPFKKFVLSGLDKIKDLNPEAICPGHGPVLTETIQKRMSDYYKWSKTETPQDKFVAVLYASAYGCTKKLAKAAVDSINNSHGNIYAELIDVVSTPAQDISSKISRASGIMVGSCTINRDAPKIIWDALSSIDAINSRGKPAGCFGSYGWSGEAVGMIQERLRSLGFKVSDEVVKVNFMPTDEDIRSIENYAHEIVSAIK